MTHLAALSVPPDAVGGHRAAELVQLVQALSAAPDETARLQLAVDSAVTLVARCDQAAITTNATRGSLTRVSSDDVIQRAHELGARSMMSLLVHTDEHSYGALSLYTAGGQRFDSDDVATGHAIAAHLAVVMTAKREIDHLGLAMVGRVVIGRAEGILMERLDISADQAFEFLRRVSSQTNVKLVDVAEKIARTRVLPHLA